MLPSLAVLSGILVGSELALAFGKRSRSRGKDRATLPLLWLVIGVSVALAFELRAHFPAGRLPQPRAFYFTGPVLFIAGLIVRWAAIIHLGRFFTVNVAIAKDHKLVTTGPYRFVRHPSYSGTLLIFLGFGLCLLNWASLLAMVLPITLAFLWRVRVEEEALREAFGEHYRAYAAKTPRLLPFVY